MKFSIVTITYNAERYLTPMLESVAEQDFPHFEHIIWDGGSSDRTLAIACSFPHVTLYQGSDEGISDAMNRGAFLAKGDFLLHLHADDCLAHSRVLSMVNTCLKQHPSIQWLYGKAHIVDEKGNRFILILFLNV